MSDSLPGKDGASASADITLSKLAHRLDQLAVSTIPAAVSTRELGASSDAERRLVSRYVSDEKLVILGKDYVVGTLVYHALTQRVVSLLGDRGVASPSAVGEALQVGYKFVDLLLDALHAARIIERIGVEWRLTRARSIDPLEVFKAMLSDLEKVAAPEIRSFFDLGIDSNSKREVVAQLVLSGRFVAMDDKTIMSASAFEQLSEQVRGLILRRGPLTVAEIRNELQIGRKVLILVVEAMDHAGITRRDGDRRYVPQAND